MSNPYHSKFGGTWIDRSDFPDELARRVAAGLVPAELAPTLQQFARDGYCVLPGAAAGEDIDRFESAISRAFREGHPHLVGLSHGSGEPKRVSAGLDRKQIRIVDSFAVMPEGLALLASRRLVEFIRLVLDDKPLLFQSISFDMGSQQGLHQDTAYVVVNRPMELVACWIALEDIKPGSGELQYMVGSHRLPDFEFSPGRKHWNSVEDGLDRHTQWFNWIYSEGEHRGLRIERFLAKRGDILVWHADLAHGGSPIADPSLTRKSLVGHYCPFGAVPHYMRDAPHRRTVLEYAGIGYSSWYYDLAALSSNERRAAALAALFESQQGGS